MTPKELPEEIKNKLRKIKTKTVLARNIRRIAMIGVINEAALDQFDTDLRLYNLYEAILYVESYQIQGFYNENTTECICKYILENVKCTNIMY